MQLEVGSVHEGKVTGITKFGAFVELEKGTTGLVHISEVSTQYVNDINEHLSVNDTVKVKVLSVSDDGKISLSIRRAAEAENGGARPQQQNRNDRKPFNNDGHNRFQPRENREGNHFDNNRPRAPRQGGSKPQSFNKRSSEPTTFEDMMARFKQSSDEISRDLKRKTGDRRTSRKGGSK